MAEMTGGGRVRACGGGDLAGQISDGCRHARRRASRGASLVPMVKSTHFRERHHAAFCRPVNPSRRGRVFLEEEMGPRPMIVGDVLSQHAAQVLVTQNDHVIQTLAA